MTTSKSAYEAAGVSIDAGNQAVQLMREAVRSTYTPDVLAGIGSFGGVYDARRLIELPAPALVASTDGVGTKTKLAAAMRRYDRIGMDIVNHCINDILVQGARPLFFLDYIASNELNPHMVAEIVSGIAAACRDAGCALIGGETAEMPGVYRPGEFDLVGTIVGVVSRECILPSADICAGDAILGLPSSGPHTNGYSLIRHILADTSLDSEFDGIGVLGEALLTPHRSYLSDVTALQQHTTVKGMAHITGGGLIENVPRILPADLDAHIRRSAWATPALFQFLQHRGEVDPLEMYRVFNMGIGMIVIIPAGDVERALSSQATCTLIGEVTPGSGKVILE
jgi:phosphoribosylformylglycinamidine cyclo-ligase